MIPQELIKQIRRIQIFTNRRVNETFAGEYVSTFRGQGMQFDEVREYFPGDEVRSIDWNVTARMGKPYIKRFVEEREQTVMLLVDVSASVRFGTARRCKNELAAELCAVLAFSAIKNNDKVGLIIFSDKIEHYIPPKKGVQHVLRVVRELMYNEASASATDVTVALNYLARVQRKHATVFLVSDFLVPDCRRTLRLINRRHDLIAIELRDRIEISLPRAGLVSFRDVETGQIRLVDTSSAKVRRRYEDMVQRREARIAEMFKVSRVDCIKVYSDKDYVPELIRFFRTREKRGRVV